MSKHVNTIDVSLADIARNLLNKLEELGADVDGAMVEFDSENETVSVIQEIMNEKGQLIRFVMGYEDY